jgi:hypothetical protein
MSNPKWRGIVWWNGNESIDMYACGYCDIEKNPTIALHHVFFSQETCHDNTLLYEWNATCHCQYSIQGIET